MAFFETFPRERFRPTGSPELLDSVSSRLVLGERTGLPVRSIGLGAGGPGQEPTIGTIAEARGTSPAQVMLRWGV